MLEIDVQGARQVLEKLPDALVVLLLPPSIDDQIARLRGRGDSEEHVAKRVRLGHSEVEEARRLTDRVVVNDDLQTTVEELLAMIDGARTRRLDGTRLDP